MSNTAAPQPPSPSSGPRPDGPAEGAAGSAPRVVVGLDIGGSKTHGVLWRNGALAAEAKAGSANVQNVTQDEAAQSLSRLFRELVPEGQTGGIDRVVAGSGGVDT